jgi:hypothetical protein
MWLVHLLILDMVWEDVSADPGWVTIVVLSWAQPPSAARHKLTSHPPPPNMTLCIIVVLGYPARLHFNVSIVIIQIDPLPGLLVSSQCTRLLSVSADAQAAAAGCSRHRPIGNSCDAPLLICSALNSTFTC